VRRSLSITKKISPPGPTFVASDEFANAARPFADRKIFLVFLGSNYRWISDTFAYLLQLEMASSIEPRNSVALLYFEWSRMCRFKEICWWKVAEKQFPVSSSSFSASSSIHCLAALDLGASAEQPFHCLIIQNLKACGRWGGRWIRHWSTTRSSVYSLFFCATFTGNSGDHTPFARAGSETSDTGTEQCC